MGRGSKLLVWLVLITGASSLQYDESELSELPKHFHLDDYEKCLDRTDGVFCLGQFVVYSDDEDNPTYKFVKKYSQDPYLYNRTYLHRGYCLTTRCAGADANLTARFERCVDKWARHRHGLRARLLQLKFCKEHGKPLANAPDTQDLPHRVFLYVVLALLAFNVVGTIYDLNVDKKGNKDALLRIWSIRHNWNILTARNPNTDLGLKTLDGLKGFMSFTPELAHGFIFIGALYQHNPRAIEKFIRGPPGPMVGALTNATQVYTIMSTFLTSYIILMTPGVNLKMLPLLVLKRLVRFLPIYLLGVGFAATWWTSAGAGPMWHIVERESAICKRKFWLMATFRQNIVDPRNVCLIQTWIMAVDMQMHIPVLVLSIALKRCRRWALPVIGALFAIALALTTHLAFDRGYVPAYSYTSSAQDFFENYYNNKSMTEFLMTSANCMISTVVGMWLAFYHTDLRQRGVKLTGYKSLVFLTCLTFLGIFVWSYYCNYLIFDDTKLLHAMIPIERVVIGILLGILLLLLMNTEYGLVSFFRWHILTIISRMALSIAMIHWCINGIIAGNRQVPFEFTCINGVLDIIVTFFVSCIMAIPLTLMVELPIKQVFDRALKILM